MALVSHMKTKLVDVPQNKYMEKIAIATKRSRNNADDVYVLTHLLMMQV